VDLFLENDYESDAGEPPVVHRVTLQSIEAPNHLGLHVDTSDFHELSRYHNPFEQNL